MADYAGRGLACGVFGLSLILSVAPAAAPVHVGAPLSIPVPLAPLAKGIVIGAADLTSLSVPANRVFISTVSAPEEALGFQTLRPLPAGQPISKLHLRLAPLVSRGATIPFIFARGTVQLSGSAQALEDGAAGQTIRLLNPATRATLTGIVQPNGSVSVN